MTETVSNTEQVQATGLTACGEYRTHPAAEAFPMLGEEELQALAEDIKVNGLREPIWLYEDPKHGLVLLDGRNRLAACKRVGVESVDARMYEGDEPVQFVISQNINRRHLSAGQKASAASRLKPYFEEVAAERKSSGKGDDGSGGRGIKKNLPADRREGFCEDKNASSTDGKPQPSSNRRQRESAYQAASAVGASGRSVERYERVKSKAPDLASKVDAGEIALDRAERIIRDREAEQRRIEQAKKEAEAQEGQVHVDIRQGDFREALADVDKVDAIITDPPYPKEYLPLLEDLARIADEKLTEDGVLAILIGQTYLPEVYRLLSGGRPYRWTACYYTPGPGYASYAARVQSNWKPLIVYGGGPRFQDVIRSEGSDADAKENHKWGQDYSAFHTIIQRLTSPGQTVLDPFMGAGTTLLAAKALGRHVIGCDVEEESVNRARERVAGGKEGLKDVS